MSKLPWFRLHTDIIDDEKIRLLAFEDRWHFVALMCCKRSGLLDKGDPPDLLRRKLSVKLGLAMRELEAAVLRIAEVGLICNETFQPIAWDDRQFLSDNSSDRVKRHRDRVKRFSNVSVTPPETDTEPDDRAESTASAAKKRGTRLPLDWEPSDDLKLWAHCQHGFDPIEFPSEIASFKDYWKAKTGKDATKHDWDATFRNWIRKAIKFRSGGVNEKSERHSAIDRVAGNVRRSNQSAPAGFEYGGRVIDHG